MRTRDCLYERRSQHTDGEWALADRRCYRLARERMQGYVQTRLLAGVSTLKYDAKLADGLKHNYGASGWCTEVVKDFGAGRKVAPGNTCADMCEDAERVGFVMGRRAGDSGLPHERGHLRTLGQAIGDDDGSEVEDVEEERLPGQGARLTAAQRSERLGCAGCTVWVPSNVCSKCDRWTGGAEHDECEKCRAEGEGEWVLAHFEVHSLPTGLERTGPLGG